MNITFMVGNGFDISSGLKTSYNSFYQWYVKQKSDNESVNAMRKRIREYLEKKNEDKPLLPQDNWSDLESAFGVYSEEFDVDTVHEYLDCYEDLQRCIAEYISTQVESYDFQEVANEEIEALRQGLLAFYAELPPVEQDAIKSVIQQHEVSNNTELRFISFNYTDLLDYFVDKISDEPLKRWTGRNGNPLTTKVRKKVVHTHGTLDEYPVLGVDDTYQIKNQDLLRTPLLEEILVKHASVNSLGQYWHRDAENQINDSTIICVWGMSLGSTDGRWWTVLNKWLEVDNTRHLIIFWHSQENDNRISTRNTLETKRRIQNVFFDYSDFTAEKIKTLFSRVHIIINTTKVLRVLLQEKAHDSELSSFAK